MIILGILKVIALAILFAIGLVLIVLTLLLFVPFKYYAKGDICENYMGTIRVSWLLKIFRLSYVYTKTSEILTFKVLFFTVKKVVKIGEQKEEEIQEEMKKEVLGEKVLSKTSKEKKAKNVDKETTGRKEEQDEKPKSPLNKAKEKFQSAKEYYEKNNIKNVIGLCFELVKKILNEIKPKKLVLSGKFGLEEPHKTGQAVGAIYVLLGFLRLDADISGKYDEQVFDLKAEIVGQIVLIKLLIPILFFVFEKQIWGIIKTVFTKKEINYE